MNLNGGGAGTSPASARRIDVACFATGVLIATPMGHRPIESLKPGDRVLTRDNGPQEIAWIGAKKLHWTHLRDLPHLQPIRIARGTLENGAPAEDLIVSPEHRVVLRDAEGGDDVLVPARELVGNPGISVVESMGVTYHHLMFEEHQIILSGGAWSESFQPTDFSLAAVGNAARSEILRLFPELTGLPGLKGYKAALPTRAPGAILRFH